MSAALDAESRVTAGHQAELRLWLRLLSCTNLMEAEIRRRLRLHFATTLPRFDLLAALEREPAGLTAGAVSRRMMVSNGNVSGLAARLEAEGLIERRGDPSDRRVQRLRLTARGRRDFARQSAAHAAWVAEFLGALPAAERDALHALLGRAKAGLRAALAKEHEA